VHDIKIEITRHLSSERVNFSYTLTLQKSRVLQIQGAKGAAVVIYRKPLTTLVEDPVNSGEMRCHRLSRRVNNMAAFH